MPEKKKSANTNPRVKAPVPLAKAKRATKGRPPELKDNERKTKPDGPKPISTTKRLPKGK